MSVQYVRAKKRSVRTKYCRRKCCERRKTMADFVDRLSRAHGDLVTIVAFVTIVANFLSQMSPVEVRAKNGHVIRALEEFYGQTFLSQSELLVTSQCTLPARISMNERTRAPPWPVIRLSGGPCSSNASLWLSTDGENRTDDLEH